MFNLIDAETLQKQLQNNIQSNYNEGGEDECFDKYFNDSFNEFQRNILQRNSMENQNNTHVNVNLNNNIQGNNNDDNLKVGGQADFGKNVNVRQHFEHFIKKSLDDSSNKSVDTKDIDGNYDISMEINNLPTFREAVKKLIKVETELSKLNKEIKEWRELKKSLHEKIMKYMEGTNIQKLNLPDKTHLSKKKSTTTLNPFTKKRIPGGLIAYFKSKNMNHEDSVKKTNEIIEFIKARAPKKTSDVLRKTKK